MKQKVRGSQRLLEAARQLLRNGGPGAVTVQGMARLAKVSAPSLYKHFRNRDEVIERLQADGWIELRAALATCLRKKTPLARLRTSGQRYVEFGLDRPQLYRLLFLSEEASRPRGESERSTSSGLAFLVDLVKDCQSSGDLPSRASADDLALAFWATCHGLVALYLLGGGEPRFARERYLAMARRALVSLTSRPTMSSASEARRSR